MLTLKGMSAAAASGYHEKDSYYELEGKGQWSGNLAKQMCREGQIDSNDWNKNALWGKDRNGNVLVEYKPREYTDKNGTVKIQEKEGGTDVQYAIPKGFSIVVESYKDSPVPQLRELAEKILIAHHAAVAKTNAYIEKNLIAARVWDKEKGEVELEFTGKAAIGNYDHHTSRVGDPNLHTHSFFLNITQTADGKWRAIDNHPIYENQKYLGQIHMSEFAIALKEQDVPLLDITNGNVELAGMPKEVIEHASKRSKQIEEILPELRRKYPSAGESRLREMACLATRPAKEIITNVEEWRSNLRNEFGQLGFSDKVIADLIDQARPIARAKYAKQPDAQDAIQKAADVLSYGQSVFSQRDLVLQCAQLYPSAHRIGNLEQAANDLLADGKHLKNLTGNGKNITTSDMERIEAENVSLARSGVGQVERLLDIRRAREKAATIRINGERGLTKSQQEAYVTVASTNDRVVIMQGYAGTGKTTLFDELKKEFKEAGLNVRGLAYTGKAAGELSGASGIKSSTIHSFLQSEESMRSDTVYVIDEASMVGSRQLNTILTKAEKAGSRVILSGDRWQIPSVTAGRPFMDIQDDHKIASAYLTDIVRQRHGSPEHKISQAFVERKAELIIDALEKAGSVRYEPNAEKRTDNAFNEVLGDWKKTIAMATTNAQVREDGDRFHSALKGRGEIGQNDIKVSIKEPVSFHTDAARFFIQNYEDNDFLQINDKWRGGPKRGSLHQVIGRDEAKGVLYVKNQAGARRAIDVKLHGMDISAYRERDIMLSEGDKIMFLKNSLNGTGRIGVRNGDLAFVREISDDGKKMVVDRVKDLKKGEFEKIVVPLDKYDYFRYGYVGTVDKSQGATAPKAVARDLVDFQRTYVAGTRENQSLSLHFESPEALRKALNTYLTKSSSWHVNQEKAKDEIWNARFGKNASKDDFGAVGRQGIEERTTERVRQVELEM